MTPAIAAMVTAVVGVFGTLSAPILGQFMTGRQNREKNLAADTRRKFEERRAAYTAMNRASREFDTVLKDALHRIRDGAYGDEERAEVESVRRAYRDRYAEIQMIVPQRVLDASRAVNFVLAEVDAAVKRLDRKRQHDGETPEGVLADLKEADPGLRALSELMREDLGVET
jgi:hypothetical protein